MRYTPISTLRQAVAMAGLWVGAFACSPSPKDGSPGSAGDDSHVDSAPTDDTSAPDTGPEGVHDTGAPVDTGGSDCEEGGAEDDDDAGDDEDAGEDGGDSEDSPEELCNGVDDDGDGLIDEDACPDWGATDPLTGRAYLVVQTPLMWFDAVTYCASYGYALATIDDAVENQFVWELVFDGEDGVATANAHTWIGLHEDAGGSWSWSAGDALGFTAWNGTEITDDYGTLTYGQAAALGDEAAASWFEAPQTWFHHAVCESP